MYEYNYYNFKKQINLPADIVIDRSGFEVQPDAKSLIAGEDGEMIELNMNEIIDDKVDLIFLKDVLKKQVTKPGGVIGTDGGGFISLLNTAVNSPLLNQVKYVAGEPVLSELSVATSGEKDSNGETIHVEGFTESDIDYGSIPSTPARLIVEGVDDLGRPQTHDIRIIPKYKLLKVEKGDALVADVGTISNRGPQSDRGFLAAMGIYDSRGYVLDLTNEPMKETVIDVPEAVVRENKRLNIYQRNKLGLDDDEIIPVMSVAEFDSTLKNLIRKLNPHNITVRKATRYGESRNEKNVDINTSYLYRWSYLNKPRYHEAALHSFKKDKSAQGTPIEPMPNEDVSPFTPSIKTLFKARFHDKQYLERRLGAKIQELLQTMTNFPKSSSYFKEIIDEINEFVKTEEVKDERGNIIYARDPSTGEYATSDGKPWNPPKQILDASGKYVDARNKDGKVIAKFPNEKGKEVEYLETRTPELKVSITNTRILSTVTRKIRKKVNRAIATSVATSVFSFGLGVVATMAILFAATSLRRSANRFDLIVKQIMYFEAHTNESVFENRAFITDKNERFTNLDTKLARFIVPVDMGRTLTRKKWNYWKFRYDRTYKNHGVRWIDVEFIDTSPLQKYRHNNTPSGESEETNLIPSSMTFNTNGTVGLNFDEPHGLGEDLNGIQVLGTGNKLYNGTFEATTIGRKDVTKAPVFSPNTIWYIPDRIADEDLTGDVAGSGFTRITNLARALNIIIATGGRRTVAVTDVRVIKTIKKYAPTKPDGIRENIEISFSIPHLPSFDAIRKSAFNMYGSFDRTESKDISEENDLESIDVIDSNGTRTTRNIIPAGYEIFPRTSNEISDMRSGLDIYSKVQFLMSILEDAFNKTRVKLVNTTRSHADQEAIQLGGESSNFLSWHNYGLSVKILIMGEDGLSPIKRRTEDFWKLLYIARDFVKGCKEGRFGEPINAVWGEQLVVGGNMFVWEFLPIGVEHRDAWKFRDAAFNQQDPIVANAFVNVTKNNYAILPDDPTPLDSPYIRKNSESYQNAIVINGDRYVHPSNIINYKVPSELVLKDVQEFIFMIQNKFDANGTELFQTRSVAKWRNQNPTSYHQLVMYNALTNNLSVAQALLAIDYIDEFKLKLLSLANSNPVKFVKEILDGDSIAGESEYKNVKITVNGAPDGSYISLHNGKITMPVLDARSTHPAGNKNTFGQKQIDDESVEFGVYDDDNIFVPEGDLTDEEKEQITIESDEPVIDGYEPIVDNNEEFVLNSRGQKQYEPIHGDAIFLHVLVKGKILSETDAINELFKTLDTKFLYDDLKKSPRAELSNTTENEFGMIEAQTLTSIERLIEIYKKMDSDDATNLYGDDFQNDNLDVSTDPNVNEQADRNKNQSVFEKLVSNAQISGIQLAKLTKEKPIIEPERPQTSVEKTIKAINKDKEPDSRDIL